MGNNRIISQKRKVSYRLFISIFYKKRLKERCFPKKIAKFLRTSLLKNICERLLL